jgi:hypothetical protein
MGKYGQSLYFSFDFRFGRWQNRGQWLAVQPIGVRFLTGVIALAGLQTGQELINER